LPRAVSQIMCHVLFHGASACVSPLLPRVVEPLPCFAAPARRRRLPPTRCAAAACRHVRMPPGGPPRRKAALADHYGRCRGHTSSGSPVNIASHDNENRSKR
jgi:hypothetical protein